MQKGRDAAQIKAEAGTANQYTKATEKAAAAAQLAATAAAVAAAKTVKAAAAPEKVTVKELTGSKRTRRQVPGKKQLEKKKERTRGRSRPPVCSSPR